MLRTPSLIVVALALLAGCEESNTNVQKQPNSSGPLTGSGASVGRPTNPHMPNPTHASQGTEMGSATMQPGAANNPMAPAAHDAGVPRVDGGVEGRENE